MVLRRFGRRAGCVPARSTHRSVRRGYSSSGSEPAARRDRRLPGPSRQDRSRRGFRRHHGTHRVVSRRMRPGGGAIRRRQRARGVPFAAHSGRGVPVRQRTGRRFPEDKERVGDRSDLERRRDCRRPHRHRPRWSCFPGSAPLRFQGSGEAPRREGSGRGAGSAR